MRDVTIALSAAQLGTTFHPRSVAFRTVSIQFACFVQPTGIGEHA